MADTTQAAAPAAATAAAPAAAPVAAPAAQAVDPAKRYRVTLKRAVQVAPRVWARPSTHEVILVGSQIAQHGDAIASYEEV